MVHLESTWPQPRALGPRAFAFIGHSKWRQWIVLSLKAEPVNSGLETTPDLAFKQEAIEKSKVGRRKYIPWNGRQGRVAEAKLWQ